jgi:hypothetical protein
MLRHIPRASKAHVRRAKLTPVWVGLGGRASHHFTEAMVAEMPNTEAATYIAGSGIWRRRLHGGMACCSEVTDYLTEMTTIDLTDPDALTLDSVRRLLASKDDSDHRQLRVNEAGVAYLSDDVGFENLDGVRFRLATFSAGAGYTGPEAAADDDFVQRVLDALKRHWSDGTRGYVELF